MSDARPTVTRDDVATKAGVSSATVSRVFNGNARVDRTMAKRVRRAARTLGYKPNRQASSLRRSTGGTILVVAESHFLQGPTWYAFSWYWAQAVHAVQRVINQSLFSMELATVRGTADMHRLLARGDIAGVLFNNVIDSRLVQVAAAAAKPLVACGRDFIDERFPRVISDETMGGRLAAEYLRDTGHRSPACVTASLNSGFADRDLPQRARVAGFTSVFPNATVLEGGYDRAWGEQAMAQLVPRIRRGRIDSVFCYNSWVAVGAAITASRAGLDVPQRCSMIAYDASPLFEALPYRMATVDYRIPELYTAAARKLLSLVAGHAMPVMERLAPVLIPGESVADRR